MKTFRGWVLLGALQLTACAAAPESAPALQDTRWNAVSASGPFAALAANSGITLEFEAERITGHGGCNRYIAPYRFEAGILTAGPTTSTKRACRGSGDTIERAWFGLLSKPVRVSVSGDELTLEGEESLIFRFVRATP
jgi:heat shock protein HslJ